MNELEQENRKLKESVKKQREGLRKVNFSREIATETKRSVEFKRTNR